MYRSTYMYIYYTCMVYTCTCVHCIHVHVGWILLLLVVVVVSVLVCYFSCTYCFVPAIPLSLIQKTVMMKTWNGLGLTSLKGWWPQMEGRRRLMEEWYISVSHEGASLQTCTVLLYSGTIMRENCEFHSFVIIHKLCFPRILPCTCSTKCNYSTCTCTYIQSRAPGTVHVFVLSILDGKLIWEKLFCKIRKFALLVFCKQ